MTERDLVRLESFTKDYAAFQARKSGLATALGGLMALLLIVLPMYRDLLLVHFLGIPFLGMVLCVPFLWLILKQLLAQRLYRGLGTVKAVADAASERRRGLWLFGIAFFLVAFLTAMVAAFAYGILGLPRDPSGLIRAQAWLPHPWILAFPLLYLAAAPWWIRGVEEARAYAVLVAQCCQWIWWRLVMNYLPWRRGPESLGFTAAFVLGMLLVTLAVMAWAALSVIRGLREHRDYVAMLKSLSLPTR